MKKYLLGLALVGAMVCSTSTAFAGTPKKVVAKTEQTATVKKNAAAKDAKKCCTKVTKKATKKATVAKKAAKKTTVKKAAKAKK